ncbi:EamA family transporter [Rhodobacterales bacterium HKCCE3408]|nr:EamA family transporter [Rhodobacterales bacterium HKCCE3408]
MHDTARLNLSGVAFALAGFGIWATHDVFVKLLGATYSPVQIIFFSVVFGFPVLTLLMMRDAKDGNLRPVHPWWTLGRTVATVVTGLTAFYAFGTLPLAQVYTILFAAPLLITILSIPILGERVGWRRWLAVVAGLCGVIIVLRPGAAPLELGHIAAVVAAFGSAIASVIMRKIGRDERTLVMMLYPMMGNFLVMGLWLGFVYEPMPVRDLAFNAIIAALALVALACVIQAYSRAPAAIVAPMQYSQILWASVYGFVIFDETLDRPTLIGSAIIIASGMYIVLREAYGTTSRSRPVLETRTRAGTPSVPRVSTFLTRRARREND